MYLYAATSRLWRVLKGAFGVRKLLTSRNETYGRIVGDIQRPNPENRETRGGHVLKALRFEDGKIHSFSAAFHSFSDRRKKTFVRVSRYIRVF